MLAKVHMPTAMSTREVSRTNRTLLELRSPTILSVVPGWILLWIARQIRLSPWKMQAGRHEGWNGPLDALETIAGSCKSWMVS